MKASELIKALETEIKLNGDLEVRIAATKVLVALAGIATQFSDEDKPSYFILCDDSAYDIIHVGD